MHQIKTTPTYEVKFAIGSREGYDGPSFTKEQLMTAIGEFQTKHPHRMPVKITDKVTFVMMDYREDGWDISGICYPNSQNKPAQVKEFMYDLALYLLYHFKQNRITVRCFPSWMPNSEVRDNEWVDVIEYPSTEMFEIENAQKAATK